jgi:hypothetical protein
MEYGVPRTFAADILNVSMRTLDRYVRRKKITSVRRGRQLYFSEQELLTLKAEQIAEDSLREQEMIRERDRRDRRQRDAMRQQDRTWGSHGGEFVEVEEAQIRERESAKDVGSSDHVADSMAEREVADEVIEQPTDGRQVKLVDEMLVKDSIEARMYKRMYEDVRADIGLMRDQLKTAQVFILELKEKLSDRVPMLSFQNQQEALVQLTDRAKDQEKKVAVLKSRLHLREKKFAHEVAQVQLAARGVTAELQALERQIAIEKVSRLVYGILLFLVAATIPLALMVRHIG